MSTDPQTHEFTRLLRAWGSGDQQALEALTVKVYDELHRMARHYMQNEQNAVTLQPTALVHEVYLKLVDVEEVNWQDRAHFFAVSAKMMRRILVDQARARRSVKRGGGAPLVDLDKALEMSIGHRDREVIAIDEALDALAELDSRKGRVVELRFFGGLSADETAAALNISPRCVARDWKLAKAWLSRELTREATTGPADRL